MDKDIQEEAKHKEMLRQLFAEALHQGKMAIIDTIFSPHFVDHSTLDQPPGSASVKAYFSEIRRGFPDIQVVLEDLIAEGDRVVVRTTWRGTHLGTYEGVPPSGKAVARTMIQIFRIVDGLIVEEWNEGLGLLDALHSS